MFTFYSLTISLYSSSGFLYTSSTVTNNVCVSGGSPAARHYNTAISYLCIIVPACLMFFFMTLITLQLRQHQRSRTSTCGATSRGSLTAKKRIVQQRIAERALTVMFLVAAFIFLLLSFPLFLFIIGEFPGVSKFYSTPAEIARFHLVHEIAKVMEIFSHATNFFVYFLSARKFRDQLRILFCCEKKVVYIHRHTGCGKRHVNRTVS